MSTATELAEHIQSSGTMASGGTTAMRVGNIASVVEPGKVMITLGGDTQAVPARHLGSYTPSAGDTVLVLVQEPDLLVMGSITKGQDVSDQIPEERDFTQNPIQEFELGQESIVAHHVKDARLGELSLALDTLRNEVLTQGVIEEVHISDDTITAPMLKANIITSDHINGRQITGEHIVGDSVTANEIATETIAADTAFLNNLVVDDGNIANLDAGKITSGTISANRIGAGTISAGTVNINTLLDMLSSGVIRAAAGRVRIEGDDGVRLLADAPGSSSLRNEINWYTTETGSIRIGGLMAWNGGISDRPTVLFNRYSRIIIRASDTTNTATGDVYIGEPGGNPGSNLHVQGNLSVWGSVNGISASDVGAASSIHSHATLTAGTGLSGTGYNGSTARTWTVDSSVIRTSGHQSMSGIKTFTGTLAVAWGASVSGITASMVGAAPSSHNHNYASTTHTHSYASTYHGHASIIDGGAVRATSGTIWIEPSGSGNDRYIVDTGYFEPYYLNSGNPYLGRSHSRRRWQQLYAINDANTSSDERGKKDLRTSELGLNLIRLLEPMQGKRKNIPNDKTHHWFVAQQVSRALEALGKSEDDAAFIERSVPDEDDEGSDDEYGLIYTEFIPILAKAIQELDERLAEVEGSPRKNKPA